MGMVSRSTDSGKLMCEMRSVQAIQARQSLRERHVTLDWIFESNLSSMASISYRKDRRI